MGLSSEAFSRARRFLREEARPLERTRYAFEFEGGSADAVVQELARFQNHDGGFGNALEPDLRTPDSSALATSIAFQILRDLPAGTGDELAARAIQWLAANFNATTRSWPIIPAGANESPRAPWWNHDAETASKSQGNPTPELAGFLVANRDLAPDDLREEAISSALAFLESTPELEMHEFQCFVRLAETAQLADETRDRIVPRLRSEARRLVVVDPAEWQGYGLRPLGVVSSPASLLAADFPESVDLELNSLLETQGEDGAWAPSWSWFGNFDEAWPRAERDWKGWLTLDNLKKLRAFGKLA